MSNSSAVRNCSDSYLDILLQLNCDSFIIGLASGQIKMPRFTYETPFSSHLDFPPALIPILSNGAWPGYIGLIRHWFGNAADTFVKYYAEQSLMVEIANNVDQLRIWLVFEFLGNVPAVDEVARFAASAGFSSMSDAEQYLGMCESFEDLAGLDVFSNAPAILRRGDGRPNWMCDADSFEQHMRSENFESAWYALNSPGKDVQSMAMGLDALLTHAKSPHFARLIRAWKLCNVP